MRSGIFGKAAAGLAAVLLTLGGGSAVAMAATGSANPMDLGQRVADIVQGCKDTIRAQEKDTPANAHAASAARTNRGIGQCVSMQVNKNRHGEAQQEANGVKDADEHTAASPSTSHGTDHGKGNGGGSIGAPGQSGAGHGNSGDHRPTPSPHTPSPHP